MLAAPGLPALELQNRLSEQGSPYLAMHAKDPVHWQPWGEAALEMGRANGRLIFVSVGYYACHWCHVMQRESFQDRELASLLNRHFIPVKVDREVHPVLDRQLQRFVEATAGRAGWPLNVFLTPGGDPLVGTTYQPPKVFEGFARRLLSRWRDDRQHLERLAGDAATALERQMSRGRKPVDVSPQGLTQQFVAAAHERADRLQGGFGHQSKFPMVPQLQTLLGLAGEDQWGWLPDFLVLTLDQMAGQGLRDHVGGGFFRYTVDPSWQTPHFEKMLYTNAMLADLYFEAADVFQHPAYADVARDTLAFMARSMDSGRGLVASLSAVDAGGEEGGFYLWQASQVRDLLGDDLWPVVRLAWGLQGQPGLEGGHLPRRAVAVERVAERLDLSERQVRERLDTARGRLRSDRERTRALPRDGKRLAAWNGLALSAFAHARDEPPLRDTGQSIRDFLMGLWDGSQLQRGRDPAGNGLGPGRLEDYALVAAGLLDWADAGGDARARSAAAAMAGAAWARFYDGGWCPGKGAGPLPLATCVRRHLPDEAITSPSAALLSVSRRLQGREEALKGYLAEAQTGPTSAVTARPLAYARTVAWLAGQSQAR